LLQFRIAIDASGSALTLERYQRKNFESSTCFHFKDKYNSSYKARHCKQMPSRVKERDFYTTLYSLFVLIRKYTTLLFHMCSISQDLLVAESGLRCQFQKKRHCYKK